MTTENKPDILYVQTAYQAVEDILQKTLPFPQPEGFALALNFLKTSNIYAIEAIKAQYRLDEYKRKEKE